MQELERIKGKIKIKAEIEIIEKRITKITEKIEKIKRITKEKTITAEITKITEIIKGIKEITEKIIKEKTITEKIKIITAEIIEITEKIITEKTITAEITEKIEKIRKMVEEITEITKITKITKITEKIKKLTEKINYHNNLYYNKNNPEISDFEYDTLLRKLSDLEEKYPQFKDKHSPTSKIGEKASTYFEKVIHKVFMGSLKNAYSFEELLKFEESVKEKIDNVEYIVEPKVDGLSVSLEYENGMLIRGSTRGDGFEGEDVTENLKTLNTIPKRLYKAVPFLEVRAEVYMPLNAFYELTEKQKELGQTPFKNPRNAAAGSLRQKNALIVSKRGLKAVCFNIQQIEGVNIKTHCEAIDFLSSLGLKTVPESLVFKNIKDCMQKIYDIEQEKPYYDFEIDGAVIKINSIHSREILGSNAKYPRWAIAFKYPPKEKETVLKNIEISVGRSGNLTPVAIFNPITLAKTTIKKASLHNQDFIDKNDIRIGDTILVRKAGEIIPEVVKSVCHQKNSTTYKIPNICPICKHEVVKINAFVRCLNPSCPATALQNIIHFASKEAMNIAGLGEKTVEILVKKKLIKNIYDLYTLKKEDILKLDGFREKSAKNLIDAIEKSKENPPWRLLFGLGIKCVGQKTTKTICEKYKNMLNLTKATVEDLMQIKDIGRVVAENIVKYFSSNEAKSLIVKLKDKGLNFTTSSAEKSKKNLIFAGLSVAVTGKMLNVSREKLISLVEKNGGRIVNTVSYKTTYLIAGKNPGSKLNKAKNLNINILTEDQFINLINKQGD